MIKRIIKAIIYRERASSKSYVKWLKNKGVRIGKGTVFIGPKETLVDVTRPWLVTIGEDCQITPGVVILTHDYGWAVIKRVYGEVLESAQKVVIGDNVYIGMNSTILPGVTIGSNVVIGANTVVTKDIPDNVVVVGNPARIVRTLDEYYQKRKNVQIEEAVQMVKMYYDRYNKVPDKTIMREYFWLFEDNYDELNPEFKNVMQLVDGSVEKSRRQFGENQKKFKNYEDFLRYCKMDKE